MTAPMTPAPGGGAAETVKLGDCPIGLFMFGDTLCFKAEYAGDIFIVETGEAFWGGTSVNGDRAELMVRPMSFAAALAAAHAAGFAEARDAAVAVCKERAHSHGKKHAEFVSTGKNVDWGSFGNLEHESDACAAAIASLRPGHAAGETK